MTDSPPLHILYVSQYFPPEIGAGSARAFEMAKHWLAAGHRVTVLTGFPAYPTGTPNSAVREAITRPAETESRGGLSVVRTWSLGVGERRVYDRLLAYSSFWASSSVRGLFLAPPDVVVASSPPLTVGLTGFWLSRFKRRPFVFDVRDLWPESITDLGATAPGSFFDRSLGATARLLYRRANRVVVTTEATREALVASGRTDPARTVTIPNGVETGTFTPGDDREELRESLGLRHKFLVSFIGTIGLAQDLETVLRAAVRLAGYSTRLHFLFVGEGPRKQYVIDAVARHNLPNFTFLPAQPRERVPELIRASDACLVMLRRAPVNRVVIPVRMLEFMSCARPVLLCAEGQPARVLEQSRGGLVIEPGDDAALAAAITRCLADPGLGRDMGANGRKHILHNFSRERMAQSYLEVLRRVAANTAR